MLGNILSTGEQVLILVVLLAVGFLCGKIRIFNDQSISHLSAFALKIVGPCAIVESFCRQFDSAMLRAMGIVALLAFAAHALYAAFAYVCIRGGKEPTRRVLRYGTVFANCGYMGLPLQQVLFGADGVFYGATWIGVYNLVAWSFGLVLMSGDRRQISFKKLLLNPGILAVLTGIVIFVCSIELPTIILQPIHYFSALNVARSHGHQRLLSLEGRLAHHLEARELLHHHCPASCRHPAVQHRADVPAAKGLPAGRHAAGGLHRGYRGPRRRRHDDVLDPVPAGQRDGGQPRVHQHAAVGPDAADHGGIGTKRLFIIPSASIPGGG